MPSAHGLARAGHQLLDLQIRARRRRLHGDLRCLISRAGIDHLTDVDHERDRLARLDRTLTLFAVRQLTGDVELQALALRDADEALVPTRDHLRLAERCDGDRLSPVVAVVEHLSGVGCDADVVHDDDVACLGGVAGAWRDRGDPQLRRSGGRQLDLRLDDRGRRGRARRDAVTRRNPLAGEGRGDQRRHRGGCPLGLGDVAARSEQRDRGDRGGQDDTAGTHCGDAICAAAVATGSPDRPRPGRRDGGFRFMA